MPNATDYNLTGLGDSLGFFDIGNAINDMSGGKFGMIITVALGVFFALVMIKSGFDNAVALMGTGMLMIFVIIGFAVIDWVSWSLAIPYALFCMILITLGMIIK